MKQFKSKAELFALSKTKRFAYLVANKEGMIEAKKSMLLKETDAISGMCLSAEGLITKGKYRYENDEDTGKLIRTIVANTYNFMDSHDDVHLDGVFAKSIAENKSIRHLKDHDHSIATGKVGIPLGFEEKSISWRELGLGKTGMTQALFMQSEIRKEYNEGIYRQYLNDEIDQHSVGMQYVKIELAVNDPEQYPNEYKVWQQHIAKIGNRATVEEQGYFFAVSEAKLLEVSAVMFASNGLTPTLGNKKQPEKSTLEGEPVTSTAIKGNEPVTSTHINEPERSTRILKELVFLNHKLLKV